MKKIIALILALITVAGLVSCSAENGKITDTNTEVSDTMPQGSESADMPSESESESESVSGDTEDAELSESDPNAQTNDVATSVIVDEVKAMLGEDYLANSDIEQENLFETYGINSEWVEDYTAQIAMISFNIDTFIAVKAKSGSADSVEKALTDYLSYTINNSIQYPMNLPKLKGTRVYRLGDYVFYITLGIVPDDLVDDDTAAYNAAVKNNQRVVDKINELLLKK